MSLARLVEPVRKVAWVCRPADAPFDAVGNLVSDRPNRWSREGEATIYLSSDAGLALIESGRHPEDLNGASHLLCLELSLRRVLDLRNPAVRSALDLPAGDRWIFDKERTVALATRLRTSGVCDALLVPSAGALDQADRWNAVVFADDRDALERWMDAPRIAGTIILGPASLPTAKRAGRMRALDQGARIDPEPASRRMQCEGGRECQCR